METGLFRNLKIDFDVRGFTAVAQGRIETIPPEPKVFDLPANLLRDSSDTEKDLVRMRSIGLSEGSWVKLVASIAVI